MKEIRKKSADAAVNTLIVKAYRSQTDLAWDRADTMQPQCGFGRMGICCTDCYEGPCRVNPFGANEQYSICGRSQQDLVAGFFMKKTVGGAAALVNLAEEFGVDMDKATVKSVSDIGDVMITPAYSNRYEEIGQAAAQALLAISSLKNRKTVATSVNLGVLNNGSINILLHGHVSPKAASLLAAAAAKQADAVNFVGMCGGEACGSIPLPIVTNYDSQETPLLTGAVDLLVVGEQCVMPAVAALSGKLGVALVAAATIIDSATADQALGKASAAFARRAERQADIPASKSDITVGCYNSFSPILAALSKGFAQNLVKGIVYLGGCGNIANTQDAGIAKLAKTLSEQGFFVVTGGCVGVGLAKSGLCQSTGTEEWAAVLPAGVSKIYYIGSCHDAGEFMLIAAAAKDKGLPVFAVMPEITHSKMLATAVSFINQGITTYVDITEAASVPEITLKGRLLPLSELRLAPQALAEIAAALK